MGQPADLTSLSPSLPVPVPRLPGIVQECPEHVRNCKPGEYISRDRWGRVGGLTVTEQRTHFAFWWEHGTLCRLSDCHLVTT